MSRTARARTRTTTLGAVALTAGAMTVLAPAADAATDSTVELQDKQVLVTSPVTVGPGQVVWSDDSDPRQPVQRRPLSTSGGALTAGATTVLGYARSDKQLDDFVTPGTSSVSGSRIAWTTVTDSANENRTLFVSTASGRRVTIAQDVADQPQLSGTRLLYDSARTGHHLLYNLRTKHSTDLTKKYRLTDRDDLALAGDYLAVGRPDGSVWRAHIVNDRAPVRVAAAATGGKVISYDVLAYGNYVAWTRGVELANGNVRYDNAFRDAHTMGRTVSLGKRDPIAVGTGGVIVQDQRANSSMRPWTSSTLIPLPASDTVINAPSTYGSLVGYTGNDHKPRVTRLATALGARPRSLGNAGYTRTVPTGARWSLGLVATAVPSSCSVTIRTAKKRAVTTLPCDQSVLRYGVIRTSWDATVDGTRVPTGTYTWTVNAKNATGSLVNANGSSAATAGTFTVTK